MYVLYIKIYVHLFQPGRSNPPRTMARVGLGNTLQQQPRLLDIANFGFGGHLQ